MGVFDYSLRELETYAGRNERPDDIDAFWDESVREMEALGTACKLTPARYQVPNAECFDLWYTGMDGARIHGHYLRPQKREGKLPAVCLFHGYAGNVGDFANELKWVCAGFAVASMDARGQGGQSQDVGGALGNTKAGHIIRGLIELDPKKLLFRSIFLDAAQLARIVMSMDEVDEKRVGAYGFSQGGGLTLACAALTPTLSRAVSHAPFLCDYRRVWEMDQDKDAYLELKDFFRRFDPRHEREKEYFTTLGYIDNQHIAHRIRAKVLMFTSLMDTVCPPSTQFAAYHKIIAPKEMLLYPDHAHEWLPDEADICMQFMLGM